MADWVMLWQQRTRREQRLLIGMGLLLAVGIIWYALWQPWLSREARWQQTLVREQATLRWMQQQTPRLQQLARQTPGAAIMREATRLELAIVRLQPQGARVNVTLPACTFQALMTWLDALARQGIFASSLAVSAQPTQPGWVTVTTLVLERPHAP